LHILPVTETTVSNGAINPDTQVGKRIMLHCQHQTWVDTMLLHSPTATSPALPQVKKLAGRTC